MPDPISWSYALPYLLAALVFGYLLGSIPFGLIITRLAGYGDIRAIGSGNIGTTNVLRTGNKKLAALTSLGEVLQRTPAGAIAKPYGPDTALTSAHAGLPAYLFPALPKLQLRTDIPTPHDVRRR